MNTLHLHHFIGLAIAALIITTAVRLILSNLSNVKDINRALNQRQRKTRINAKAPEHGLIFAAGQAIQINADALPDVIQIAPFGRWPTRDKKAVQVFNAESAEQILSWFNFFPKRVLRLARINTVKVWVGHPDFAPNEWPERIELGSITELMIDEHGLNARVEWNAEAMAHVSKHKFPSVAWDCDVNADGTETPAMLWSVGMWHKPNIKSVQPVINVDATYYAEDQEDEEPGTTNPEQEKPTMLKKIIAALIEAGIVKESDGEDTIIGQIGSLIQSLAWKREEITRQSALAAQMRTVLNAVADVAELPDEALAVQTVTHLNAVIAERDTQATKVTELNLQITQLNAQIEAERTARINAIIERAIETGRATKADEDNLRTQLNAEPDTAIDELLARPVQLNCKPLDLGGKKPAMMDYHQRAARFNAEVSRRMEEDALGYNDAFTAVSADPAFAPLLESQPAAE